MVRSFLCAAVLLWSAHASATDGIVRLGSGRRLAVQELVTGLQHPARLAVDDQGAVWIACRDNGFILRRTPDGRVEHVGTVPVERGRGTLTGLAIRTTAGGERTVYVAYTEAPATAVLAKATMTGQTLGPLTVIHRAGNVPTHRRIDIDIMDDGALLVTIPSFDSPSPFAPASRSAAVIRLQDDGSPMPDNPFAMPSAGTTPNAYVYTTGHRNLVGLASRSGDYTRTYAVEAGEAMADEVNRLEPGRHYGWWRHQGHCVSQAPSDRNTCPLVTFDRLPSDMAWYEHGAIAEWNGALLVATTHQPALLVMRTRTDGAVVDVDHMGDPKATFVQGADRVLTFDNGGTVERPTAVAVTPDGRVIVALDGDDGTGRIVSLVPTTPTTASVADAEDRHHTMQCSPLPASDILNVRRTGAGLDRRLVELVDLAGSVVQVRTMEAGTDHVRFDVSRLPAAVYAIRSDGWTALVTVQH